MISVNVAILNCSAPQSKYFSLFTFHLISISRCNLLLVVYLFDQFDVMCSLIFPILIFQFLFFPIA